MNFIPVSSFEGQELQLSGSDYLFLEIKIEIEPGQTNQLWSPMLQQLFPVNQSM